MTQNNIGKLTDLAEITKRVEKIYYAVVETIGYAEPSSLASELVAEALQIIHTRRKAIERIMLRYPTRYHLYEGVEEMLLVFLKQNDVIRIWTDDYIQKVVTSGLISGLRRELPRTERHRFHVAHYPDHQPVMDKIPLLPLLFEEARNYGLQTLVIVDNSAKNINQAVRVAQQDGQDLLVHLVSIDHQAPRTYLSPAFEFGTIAHRTVGHVTKLQDIRQEVLLKLNNKKVLWILDFNETLMNTEEFEHSIHAEIAKLLSDLPYNL